MLLSRYTSPVSIFVRRSFAAFQASNQFQERNASIFKFGRTGQAEFTTISREKNEKPVTAVNEKGEFVRQQSAFRHNITADGSSGFKAEAGRYHLYVSLACPWAHRTLITRKMKGLDDAISYTVTDFLMSENGWRFNPQVEHCAEDPVFGADFLKDIYGKASPGYEGRNTVPLLFDKKDKTIVNNESSEIIRMLTKEFDEFCATDKQKAIDLYPENMRSDIEAINEWVYPYINNGVYRAGMAQKQKAYDEAVSELFQYLEKAEEVLSKSRYLVGDRLTEADVRMYTTLVRFDKVYHGFFKCNKKQIKDYPNLWGYLRDLYQTSGFGDTTDFEHIRKHYMMSLLFINPTGIVSVGPDLDFNSAHGRVEKFSK